MFRHLNTLDEGAAAFLRQREAIIEHCLPLADHIARRYRGRGQPVDDFIQVARLGLVQAVNRFDRHRLGLPVVRRADGDGRSPPTLPRLRTGGQSASPLQRSPGENGHRSRRLAQRFGRAPNASEVAQHLGGHESVVAATIAGSNYTTLSTDMQTEPNDGPSIANTLGDIDPRIERCWTSKRCGR